MNIESMLTELRNERTEIERAIPIFLRLAQKSKKRRGRPSQMVEEYYGGGSCGSAPIPDAAKVGFSL
jgi:hypothetical protein